MWFKNKEKERLLQRCEQLEIELWELHKKMQQEQQNVEYTINNLVLKHVVLKKFELNKQLYFITCCKESYQQLLRINGFVSFRNSLQSVATKKEINRYEDYAKVVLGSKIYQAIDLHLLHSIYMCDSKIGRLSIRYDGLGNHIYICEIEIFNPHRFKGIGTIIIQYLIHLAKELQVQAITGTARPLDDTISHNRLLSFYKKNGFKITDYELRNFRMDINHASHGHIQK
ncbi:GNAT family N-acetyltransferase [Bacillus thuringiensis]|uniref:GNAT family N-acetyltransferase n=1 Tax=Bacillus thuringiensis TaxID=1428 RepID=UPI0011A00E2E|nr:GNAT family N-acetyltransferase [Bacillus thuringiensis]